MANEDLITQYNQLIWQMEQLRAEVIEAGDAYFNKLKSIKKRMQRVNSEIETVSRSLRQRQVQIVAAPPAMASAQTTRHDAGFHPTS